MEFTLSQRNPDKLPPILDLLLEIQRALFGAVASALRAVCVDIDEKEEIMHFYYFYDGEITDELFELASVATTEAFFSPYSVEQQILQLNYPQKIPIKGRLAYLRKNENLPADYTKEKKYKDVPELTPVGQLLLEIQQSLLGRVSHSLRKVLFSIDLDKKQISFSFYYDGEILDEDRTLADEAIKEASLAFPDYLIEKEIIRVDFPTKISASGRRYAFERYEK